MFTCYETHTHMTATKKETNATRSRKSRLEHEMCSDVQLLTHDTESLCFVTDCGLVSDIRPPTHHHLKQNQQAQVAQVFCSCASYIRVCRIVAHLLHTHALNNLERSFPYPKAAQFRVGANRLRISILLAKTHTNEHTSG